MKTIMKRLVFTMAAMMCMTLFGAAPTCFAQSATEMVTVYFVDGTAEQWIANDGATIDLVDNTNGHDTYAMSTTDNKIWSVQIPTTAKNITFNRYNSTRTVLWNSWSTAGREDRVTYVAEGTSNGKWTQATQQSTFKAGDIIFLDFSDFPSWSNDDAELYVNFTNATKADNGGLNIVIAQANPSLLSLDGTLVKITDTKYAYTFTTTTQGATVLRFWRGDSATLWNSSVAIGISDFNNGYNCVKVTGWDNTGYLSYTEQ